MRKGNRCFLFILCILLLFGSFSLNAETPEAIRVFLNGNEIIFDQPPVIEDGRTLVPARAILEKLGLSLSFNETIGEVTAENEDMTIVMILGNTVALVNGEEILIDVPAKILGGRTMVPLRFIGETMQLTVDWDESKKTIILSEKAAATPTPEPTGEPKETPMPMPSPLPEPTPEPEGYYHMTDEEIEEAIAVSRKGIDYFKAEVNEKYMTNYENGELSRYTSNCLVITPYFAIVKNPFERQTVPELKSSQGEWRTVWDDLSGSAESGEYFDEMKEMYEKEFDSGNKIYVYLKNAILLDYIWNLEVIQNGSTVPFTETRDDQHTFDIRGDYPVKEKDDILYRTKIGIDIRDIDPDKPFYISYQYSDTYDVYIDGRVYENQKKTFNDTNKIDLNDYK